MVYVSLNFSSYEPDDGLVHKFLPHREVLVLHVLSNKQFSLWFLNLISALCIMGGVATSQDIKMDIVIWKSIATFGVWMQF